MREHGGNIDAAIARFGAAPGDWIDLSTGINRVPYPVPPLPPQIWQALPTDALTDACLAAARTAYGTDAPGVALAGAQAAIQLLPHIYPKGRAAILSPTYNEHAGCFRAAGWDVAEVTSPDALPGADAAVVVNPNNPTGAVLTKQALHTLSAEVGLLIVDESFADAAPETSLLLDMPGNTVVLRSLGKFFGLAGLRLGFAFGPEALIQTLTTRAGPWAVNGPALHIGATALSDTAWHRTTRARLTAEGPRLDALARSAGWHPLGGTDLFRLYDVGDSRTRQEALARHAIWSRRFAAQPNWLRLGLPGLGEWPRLEAAMKADTASRQT